MDKGMQRGLTNYADAEFSLFLRKAFIKAMGYSEDALSRPIVGIVNTGSDYNPCHGNAEKLIEAVKRGVMLSGALPMAFPTISIHESFAHPTSMFLRNLMAMDTEEMVRAQPMDAVVLIGGCDKTIPAQLMAIASANVPAFVLPTGPMLVGHYKGQTLGACTDCRRLWAQYRAGEIDEAATEEVNGRLAPTFGTCMVMGTASTMACLAETLGMTLPGSATIPATHADRLRCAERTGAAAARACQENSPKPRDILTRAGFRNALVVLQALGGSTNAVIHLTAIAGRCGIRLDLDELDQIGRDVPMLVDLKPSGQHYMEHFHQAGGVPRLLVELKDFLNLNTITATGKTLTDWLTEAEIDPSQTVIRSREHPIQGSGSITVLHGNIAPNGAVIKHSAASARLLQHEGRAVIFESLDDLAHRVDDEALDVEADDILVLRHAGPFGAPGMPEAGYIPIPRKLARRGVKDMVRISDARMSGTAFGTIVLHIAPEAAIGGPLALLRNGDRIRLDAAGRRLDVLSSDEELTERRAKWRSLQPPEGSDRGYLNLYLRSVLQADEGCDFDFLVPGRAPAIVRSE
jgi:dihydroxy-acid dehydratase